MQTFHSLSNKPTKYFRYFHYIEFLFENVGFFVLKKSEFFDKKFDYVEYLSDFWSIFRIFIKVFRFCFYLAVSIRFSKKFVKVFVSEPTVIYFRDSRGNCFPVHIGSTNIVGVVRTGFSPYGVFCGGSMEFGIVVPIRKRLIIT